MPLLREHRRLSALVTRFNCPPGGAGATRATYGRGCDGNVVVLLRIVDPGCAFAFERLGDMQGEVRAFYNTCRHRGAPLVSGDAGVSRGFVCAYHGWSYTPDGRLTAVRDRRDSVDLDMNCRSLVPVRCERLSSTGIRTRRRWWSIWSRWRRSWTSSRSTRCGRWTGARRSRRLPCP